MSYDPFWYSSNLLVNGAFQENSRAATTYNSNNTYTYDNWYLASQNITLSQFSTNHPPNAAQFLRITATNATNSFSVMQGLTSLTLQNIIGKVITFSCLVKSDMALGSSLQLLIQGNNTADVMTTGVKTTLGTLTFDPPVGTVWQRFSLSCIVPDSGISTVKGLRARITGTTISNGANIDVAEVMLNIGPVAAPFNYYGGSVGAERRELSRYVQAYGGLSARAITSLGSAENTTNCSVIMDITKMRTIPILLANGAASDYEWVTIAGAAVDLSALPTLSSSRSSDAIAFMSGETASGLTANMAYYLRAKTNAAKLILSAELP